MRRLALIIPAKHINHRIFHVRLYPSAWFDSERTASERKCQSTGLTASHVSKMWSYLGCV